MQAKHRIYLGHVILLGLCVAIAMSLRTGESRLALQVVASAVLFALVAAGLGIAGWMLLTHRNADVSLLAGALWDLIRMMEVRNRAGAGARNAERRQLLQDFAVEGAHKVGAGRAMPMGEPTALDLTRLAFELMDRNDRDGAGHGKSVNSLRRGLFVFYAIMEVQRPEIAYRAMCEHMKLQLRLGEESGVDNFTELKQLLGLPLEWPKEADTIAAAERRGLPLARHIAITDAARRGRREIFRGVHYVPPGQAGRVFSDPGDILREMRDYIH